MGDVSSVCSMSALYDEKPVGNPVTSWEKTYSSSPHLLLMPSQVVTCPAHTSDGHHSIYKPKK